MTGAEAEGGNGRRGSTLRRQESRAGLVLLSPTFIVVLAVVVVPILWTIFIAFRDLRLRDLREVGIFGAGFTLENFIGVFTARSFFDALLTTLIYSVVGTFVFMIAWNEFLFALLFLVDKRGSWTVSLGLSQLANSTIEVPTTVVMAGAVILTVPVIALFFLTERLLVEGLTAGAEKG